MVRFLKPHTTDPPPPPASEVPAADANAADGAATPASAPAPASGRKGRAKEPPFQFITIAGNVEAVDEVRTDLLLAPATQAKADSDQDGEDDHSANTSRDIMAKRNTKFAHEALRHHEEVVCRRCWVRTLCDRAHACRKNHPAQGPVVPAPSSDRHVGARSSGTELMEVRAQRKVARRASLGGGGHGAWVARLPTWVSPRSREEAAQGVVELQKKVGPSLTTMSGLCWCV